MGTLWQGRFVAEAAEALRALNDSLPVDRRLYVDDIAGSRAHVRMLVDVGLTCLGTRPFLKPLSCAREASFSAARTSSLRTTSAGTVTSMLRRQFSFSSTEISRLEASTLIGIYGNFIRWQSAKGGTRTPTA